MKAPGLELGKVFRKVRIEVLQATNKQQVPWESSSLTGDFYFAPGRGVAVVGEAPVLKSPKVASIPAAVSGAKIIDRDGHFVKYQNGIVFDEKTGLEWTASLDRDTNWNQAQAWVESLNLAGSGGWRMPTIKELKTLYKKGTGEHNRTSLLKTSGYWVWSGKRKDSKAWGFNFSRGNWNLGIREGHYDFDGVRGFAVRTRK